MFVTGNTMLTVAQSDNVDSGTVSQPCETIIFLEDQLMFFKCNATGVLHCIPSLMCLCPRLPSLPTT